MGAGGDCATARGLLSRSGRLPAPGDAVACSRLDPRQPRGADPVHKRMPEPGRQQPPANWSPRLKANAMPASAAPAMRRKPWPTTSPSATPVARPAGRRSHGRPARCCGTSPTPGCNGAEYRRMARPARAPTGANGKRMHLTDSGLSRSVRRPRRPRSASARDQTQPAPCWGESQPKPRSPGHPHTTLVVRLRRRAVLYTGRGIAAPGIDARI